MDINASSFNKSSQALRCGNSTISTYASKRIGGDINDARCCTIHRGDRRHQRGILFLGMREDVTSEW